MDHQTVRRIIRLGGIKRIMKTRTMLFIAGTLAIGVTFGQWALTMSGNGVPFGREQQTVFTYGLPFMIVDCSPELSMRTPTWQVPLRFFANLMVAFFVFASALGLGAFFGRLFAKASRS